MKCAVYLAGKILKGNECSSLIQWREEFKQLVSEKGPEFGVSGTVCIDPQNFDPKVVESTEDFLGRDSHSIFISDAVVVDACGRVGPGTAQEILIAKYYRKPVVTIIPKGSKYHRKLEVNGHELDYKHPFLFATSDIVVESVEQAVAALLGHFSGKSPIAVKGIDVLDKAQEHYISTYLDRDVFMQEWKREIGK